MTLFRSCTVAFTVQVTYWFLRVVAPTDLVNHVNIDQRSGDMSVGSCGLVAILAWQSVSSARLQDQSSRKARVSAKRGGCCLGGGGASPLSTQFWSRNHSSLEHIDLVVGYGRSGVPLSSTRLHQ